MAPETKLLNGPDGAQDTVQDSYSDDDTTTIDLDIEAGGVLDDLPWCPPTPDPADDPTETEIAWHQRPCALCRVSYPLHPGVLVDCHAWFLCIGGFSAEILYPPYWMPLEWYLFPSHGFPQEEQPPVIESRDYSQLCRRHGTSSCRCSAQHRFPEWPI